MSLTGFSVMDIGEGFPLTGELKKRSFMRMNIKLWCTVSAIVSSRTSKRW